jgi:hypothetical protein
MLAYMLTFCREKDDENASKTRGPKLLLERDLQAIHSAFKGLRQGPGND